jgi:8-oxo-dGTP pyrophosphatase MutT (NUDIX family)
MAFPGGRRDASDASLRDTALREAEEEIGIPADTVTILTELPPVETEVTGYRVHPFLSRIEELQELRPQEDEIAEVHEIAVQDLASIAAQGEMLRHHSSGSEARPTPYYRIGRHKLWGATYRILKPLVPRLLAGEWAV